MMTFSYPWDVRLISSKQIKPLNENRRYFIHEVDSNRKFSVFTTLFRVYTTTSSVVHEQGSNDEMDSSFFSEPLHCATQGIPVDLWKDRFMIHWKHDELKNIESFVVQISLPEGLLLDRKSFYGITEPSAIVQEIFEKSDEDLSRNLASPNLLNIIFPANVRGIAFPNPDIQQLKVRVLGITEENKKLMTAENLAFLNWTGVKRKYLYLASVEPKSVIFKGMADSNTTFCVRICHQIVMSSEEDVCENKFVTKGESLIFENLKTKTMHRFTINNCTTEQQLDEFHIKTGIESEFLQSFLKFLIGFSDFRAKCGQGLPNRRTGRWGITQLDRRAR